MNKFSRRKLNYIDYIIVGFVAIGFILGFKDGLVRKIIGLIGFFVALFLAFEYSDKAGYLLLPLFSEDFELAKIVGGIFIFFFALFIVAILKRVFHPVDKVNRFVNQLLGGISGIVQMIYFLSGILILFAIFNLPSTKEREKSILYHPVYNVIPFTVNLIMGEKSKANEFLKDYINTK